MKKVITILLAGTLMVFLMAWNTAMSQYINYPYDFMGHPNNPVLYHGAPGTYDGQLCIGPYPIWDNDTMFLFYMGNVNICLATSTDGYEFTKFSGNPLLQASGSGIDSLGISGATVIRMGQEWVMYYNARQFPGWGPADKIGRATAQSLYGPWQRQSNAILSTGPLGEWDAGFITPISVVPIDTGGYMLFYYASDDFSSGTWEIGMATSPDGLNWIKHNDPATTQPPYALSDPVLKAGEPGEWDEYGFPGAAVIKKPDHYKMYYSGQNANSGDIGYAVSTDGINWEKCPLNPVYTMENDPYGQTVSILMEQPAICILNQVVFMYYDYGVIENSIGLATADVLAGVENWGSTKYDFRSTNWPNPVGESTTFFYSLDKSSDVTISVYDNSGRLAEEVFSGYQQPGKQQVTWNAGRVPAGIYFYKMQAGGKISGGKMIKL